MSDVLLSDLLGRTVYDVDGRKLGRLEEMCAVMEVRDGQPNYVVVECYVGAYGGLQAIAGGHFARHLLRLFAGLIRYERCRIPWEAIDFSDPSAPRVSRPLHELTEAG